MKADYSEVSTIYSCEVWAALPYSCCDKQTMSFAQISLADVFFFVGVIEKLNSR